jgi:hypothetical protein
MSVWSIDNKLNTDDSLEDRPASGTISINNISEGQKFGQMITKDNQLIITDPTGLNRVLVGYQYNGFGTGNHYGFKASQNTYDVLSASDNQLAMSSAFNTFKIVGTGTQVVNKPANTSTITQTFSHGLGYIPGFQAYVQNGSTYFQMPYSDFNLASGICNINISFASDSTSFYVTFECPSSGSFYAGSTNWTIRYYFTRETAS